MCISTNRETLFRLNYMKDWLADNSNQWWLLLLLLFGLSAKSLIALEEHLAPPTTVVRFYVRKSHVVILTPEMAGTVGV